MATPPNPAPRLVDKAETTALRKRSKVSRGPAIRSSVGVVRQHARGAQLLSVPLELLANPHAALVVEEQLAKERTRAMLYQAMLAGAAPAPTTSPSQATTLPPSARTTVESPPSVVSPSAPPPSPPPPATSPRAQSAVPLPPSPPPLSLSSPPSTLPPPLPRSQSPRKGALPGDHIVHCDCDGVCGGVSDASRARATRPLRRTASYRPIAGLEAHVLPPSAWPPQALEELKAAAQDLMRQPDDDIVLEGGCGPATVSTAVV